MDDTRYLLCVNRFHHFHSIGCCISGMDDHRKVGFPGKFHLPSEPVTLCVLHLRLFIPIIIQSDLTDRNSLWKRCLLF